MAENLSVVIGIKKKHDFIHVFYVKHPNSLANSIQSYVILFVDHISW